MIRMEVISVFENPAFVATVAGLWLAIGLSLSLIMTKRGHNGFGWLVVGTLFGPLAFVLAFDASRHDEALNPVAVRKLRASRTTGTVDVLAGYDGSGESSHAIAQVAQLLGDRMGRLTVATVVPFDNVLEPEQKARADLQQLFDTGGPGAARITELKVLHGRPADALRQWALEDHYDLIAVGGRGAGLSKRILGSAATELAADAKVPVLVAA
jgi:nucleotide-binding universal stress UspA family protein